MIALILAGGIGERLRPITNNIPKPMVPVNGKSFLQYHIEELKRAGIKDIVLCTGYLSNKIQEYFGDGSKFDVKIKYSIEKKPLGTAGAIKNAEKYVNNTFLVLNGDSYLKIDYNKLINFHKSKKAKLAPSTQPMLPKIVNAWQRACVTAQWQAISTTGQAPFVQLFNGIFYEETEPFPDRHRRPGSRRLHRRFC